MGGTLSGKESDLAALWHEATAEGGVSDEWHKLKESMVEHELRNRWKTSHLGKLELNRTPLSLCHSCVRPERAGVGSNAQ